MPKCPTRFQYSSNDYITPYIPKWCPPEPNNDPKRFELYCKPVPSKSEPLSHSEYLRLRAKNGGQSLSTGAVQQISEGPYTKTIWTSASNNCSTNVPVPFVHPSGYAKANGFLTEAKGAFASRGQISWYDTVNRMASMTTLRKKGNAIAAGKSCSTCDISGAINYVTPGCPDSIKSLTHLS